ncbi:hypothetical protein [Bacillus mojavensis]
MNKSLDFNASISNVKQINPLFSTCKVRVMYTGKNRNLSVITKDAVEKALPTLSGIPIVGEFSMELKDFKGHGGKIDTNTMEYLHTTKPYGFVPESATFEWEEIRGKQYLTIDGCYLWTGRYEEAFSVVDKGKSQSMEIEIVDGYWDEAEGAYVINDFIFSALCILGDDVEPAFEDASIRAYSKETFKKEFSKMMKDLERTLKEEKIKEEFEMNLEELLAKYSVSVEELQAEGIEYENVSLEELEASLVEFAKKKKKKDDEEEEKDTENKDDDSKDEDTEDDKKTDPKDNKDKTDDTKPSDDKTSDDDKKEDQKDEDEDEDEKKKKKKGKKFSDEDYEDLLEKFSSLQSELSDLKKENEKLVAFKKTIESKAHEDAAQELFTKFKLTSEDVSELNVHDFSLDQIEEKCYAILGKKMASKKFSKEDEKESSIRVVLDTIKKKDETSKSPYGGLIERFNK